MKRLMFALLLFAGALQAEDWVATQNKPYRRFITEIYSGIWAPALAGEVNQALGTTDWSYWPVGFKAGITGRGPWGPENISLLINAYGGGVSAITLRALEAELDIGLYERQVIRFERDPTGLSLAEIHALGGWTRHSQVFIPLVGGVDLAEVRSQGGGYNGTGGSLGSGLGARFIHRNLLLEVEFFYRLGFGGDITGSGDSRLLASGKPITANTSGAAFNVGVGWAF